MKLLSGLKIFHKGLFLVFLPAALNLLWLIALNDQLAKSEKSIVAATEQRQFLGALNLAFQ
ncbi:MAG: hypothetical protein K2X81_14215, partial [Candidatus Obscuribacterales bacterium]|nr:hypothetical protein [Candidatus Obscuribacterales bacterium]